MSEQVEIHTKNTVPETVCVTCLVCNGKIGIKESHKCKVRNSNEIVISFA